ncbi:MAG: thiamine pyrophosphate-binding protein [Acidimicrobiales bacterium]
MNRSTTATVGEQVAAFLEQCGVGMAFGVISIHNMPMLDALGRRQNIRFVPARGEAGAVNMADAYAWVSGGRGVVTTSTGTGAGNAAGSLVEALAAGSSVLHVTGNIDAEYLGQGRGVIHETKAQDRMLDAVSKRHHTVRSPEAIEATLRTAATEALTPPTGPVSVEIPIDLQYAGGAPSPEPELESPAAAPVAIDGDLDRAVDLIQWAERPLAWAGGGAVPARGPVADLCRRFGIPLITSNAGRGIIPEGDPLVVGNFAASEGGQDLLDRADLLISIGTHFRSNETRHYKLRLPAAHVQIDVDPAAIGRAYPCEIGLVGDAGPVVTAIVERLTEIDRDAWCRQAATTGTAVRETLSRNIGPYAELCRAMREVLPPESPLVRDVTIPASAWGNRLLAVLDPRTNVNARGGGIGQGLGMAVGAATARPDVPTSLMVGDGGLAVHLGELATVAEAQLPVVAIVFNDGGYGVLRNLQDAHFAHRSGVDLLGPDLAKLAGAFGLGYHRLAAAGDSHRVLQRAVADGGPVIVEVDCAAFGEMPVPFVPPVPVS